MKEYGEVGMVPWDSLVRRCRVVQTDNCVRIEDNSRGSDAGDFGEMEIEDLCHFY